MEVKNTILSTFKEIIQTAIISLGIFFFVYIFLVQPHRVKGDSMVPSFADGELLLTEKVEYRFGQPQRGDVIVFQAPGRDVDFIKRIIGLPGDTVQINGGYVYINGHQLDEGSYIQNGITEGDLTRKIGVDEYFVMGDNRTASYDSRAFGPILKNTIRGHAWFVYFPIFKVNGSRGMRFVSGIHYGIPNSFNGSGSSVGAAAKNNMNLAFNP